MQAFADRGPRDQGCFGLHSEGDPVDNVLEVEREWSLDVFPLFLPLQPARHTLLLRPLCEPWQA